MNEPAELHLSQELRAAEAEVEAHSHELKKELGLRDLVLTQILFIVGLPWVGGAAKLGTSHVLYWLLAILLFYSFQEKEKVAQVLTCGGRREKACGGNGRFS